MNIRDHAQKIIDCYLDRFEIDAVYKFATKPEGRNLGYCSYRTRTIFINSAITNDCDWIDTLLHEIAHAIVAECFDPSMGHCERFKQTCEILRCDPKARGRVEVSYEYKYTVSCNNGCWSAGRERIRSRKKQLYRLGLITCAVCDGKCTLIQNR